MSIEEHVEAGLAGEQTAGARRRLLRPFRIAGYRRLALPLVLSSFAQSIWIVAQVWDVIRIGGGAAQLSVVASVGAVGVVLPALLAVVVADRVRSGRSS